MHEPISRHYYGSLVNRGTMVTSKDSNANMRGRVALLVDGSCIVLEANTEGRFVIQEGGDIPSAVFLVNQT